MYVCMYVIIAYEYTKGDKSESISTSLLTPKQRWFFYYLDCTDHSAYRILNWEAGDIRELMLDAKKNLYSFLHILYFILLIISLFILRRTHVLIAVFRTEIELFYINRKYFQGVKPP